MIMKIEEEARAHGGCTASEKKNSTYQEEHTCY
jgi:hypothetical protein